MPEFISVEEFIAETLEDYSSPTTSAFTTKMTSCRNSANNIEEVGYGRLEWTSVSHHWLNVTILRETVNNSNFVTTCCLSWILGQIRMKRCVEFYSLVVGYDRLINQSQWALFKEARRTAPWIRSLCSIVLRSLFPVILCLGWTSHAFRHLCFLSISELADW